MFEPPPETITINHADYQDKLQELHDLREMRDAVMDYFRKNEPELLTIFQNRR